MVVKGPKGGDRGGREHEVTYKSLTLPPGLLSFTHFQFAFQINSLETFSYKRNTAN